VSSLREWLGTKSTQQTAESPSLEDSLAQLDRGMPRVQRPVSVTSRVTQMLAFALMGLMGFGVLGWYYASAAPRPEVERARLEKVVRTKAAGDQALPKLPPFEMPKFLVPPTPPVAAAAGNGRESSEAVSDRELDGSTVPAADSSTLIYSAQSATPNSVAGAPVLPNPQAQALARQLTGRVFERGDTAGNSSAGQAQSRSFASADASPSLADGAAWMRSVGITPPATAPASVLSPAPSADEVKARSLGGLPMRLPKGAIIDCTLLAAIDSELPGLTTCVTATDVFGADGKVVLLERGTHLVGEASAEVRPGQTRVRVIWNEARTPAGIAVNLESLATDPLGRSGLPGAVDRRFAERFGAAILMSMIEGAISAGVESQRKEGGSSVVVSSGTSRDIATEVLKETVAIPPRIRVAQGSRVAVLVAKDIDFSDVYTLVRSAGAQ
jgi:type IV secretion system protein VirB10